MEPFIGQIQAFAFNFAPRGWMTCQGQTLAIASNTALFSLIGTYYGGNGQTTFGLPDLQGRSPIGQGTGQGTTFVMGEAGGSGSVTLLSTQMPQHTHTLGFKNAVGNSSGGNTSVLSLSPSTGSGPNKSTLNTYSTSAPDAFLSPTAIGLAGGNQPLDIRNPYLAINYSIATEGIFPSRN